MQSAHGFNHRIDGIVLQNLLHIPCHFRVGEKHILQTDHLCHLHIIALFGNLVNTASNDTKTQQTDFHEFILHYQGQFCHNVELGVPDSKTLAFC